jgi:hypothetical protein
MSGSQRRSGFVLKSVADDFLAEAQAQCYNCRRSRRPTSPTESAMRPTPLLSASGITGGLLLASLLEAQASIWCPTPIPGVLIKTCLCVPFTGSAGVSTRSRLSPLRQAVLLNDLQQAANADWASRIEAFQQPRKYLSPRLRYACDINPGCTVSRNVAGPYVTYQYSCYMTARPGPCGSSRLC